VFHEGEVGIKVGQPSTEAFYTSNPSICNIQLNFMLSVKANKIFYK